jgi:hypothetical protein
MSAPADLSGEEAAALEIMSKRFLLAMIASLSPSEFQRYRDALANVGVPLSSDLPVRVALDPDPSGVSVGVWQGPRCIYTGAHPLPAPAAGDARDAQDAARYRWLRHAMPNEIRAINNLEEHEWDAAIDAAMQAMKGDGNG